MRTGLKRHIIGGAGNVDTCLLGVHNGIDFGVLRARSVRIATRDNLTVLDDHTADSRVGRGDIAPLARLFKSGAHENLIARIRHFASFLSISRSRIKRLKASGSSTLK